MPPQSHVRREQRVLVPITLDAVTSPVTAAVAAAHDDGAA